MSSNIAFAICLVLAAGFALGDVKYPIEGSWFAERYSSAEWERDLSQFKAQGGTMVWQRGPNLHIRPGGIPELKKDPDILWCWARGDCINRAVNKVTEAGAKMGTWLTYRYDDAYDDASILRCPKLDEKYILSRTYWTMLLPRSWTPEWNCSINPGDTVDVLIIYSNGMDPHRLLVNEADKLGMQVYLGMPCSPSWDEMDIIKGFYEFLSRHFVYLAKTYAKNPSFVGLYQTAEAFLGERPSPLSPIFSQIKKYMNKYLPGKLFVASPYLDVLRCVWTHSPTPLQDHIDGFKDLARMGVDVIAVQEGRGCGHGGYYWPFELNTTVESSDAKLDEILLYTEPANIKPHSTFDQVFSVSNQVLFESFAKAVEELKAEGVKTELWLNVEAFEYLRTNVCEPIDEMGNAMAELLDRTTKSRVDRALVTQAAHATHIISWVWDYDYTCTPEGYEKSLNEEIVADWDRPIVALGMKYSGTQVELHGFYIATDASIQFKFGCYGSADTTTQTASYRDPNWGKSHSRSYLLQLVRVTLPSTFHCPSGWVSATACKGTRCSYYPYYFALQL